MKCENFTPISAFFPRKRPLLSDYGRGGSHGPSPREGLMQSCPPPVCVGRRDLVYGQPAGRAIHQFTPVVPNQMIGLRRFLSSFGGTMLRLGRFLSRTRRVRLCLGKPQGVFCPTRQRARPRPARYLHPVLSRPAGRRRFAPHHKRPATGHQRRSPPFPGMLFPQRTP